MGNRNKLHNEPGIRSAETNSQCALSISHSSDSVIGNSQSPEILIVEDSAVQAEMLRRCLERAGYRVVEAKNGEEGLRAARSRPPAMVLSDIIMPLMDGYRLCHEIKCDEVLWNVPVMLLTVLSDSEDILAAINNGADGYVAKPFLETILVERISAMLATPIRRKWPVERRAVELEYKGVRRTVSGATQQMLNLLLSVHDTALSQKREFETAQSKLEVMNENLEHKVRERTAALSASVIDARHATEQATILFEQSADGMVVVDHEGRIRAVNHAAAQLFGQSANALLGAEFGTPMTTGEHAEIGLWSSADGARDVDMRSAEILWKDQPANLVSLRDITERKRAERAVEQLNEELEARVRLRTAELEASNEQLERFAYIASHDLQEPLRMVIGYVQLLEKRLADKLDADTRELMGFAMDGALRMQNLIRDILAYSRVTTRGQPLDMVDSAEALKEALTLLARGIAETGAEVVAQSLPIVMADRTQLVQLFQNLIGNAIKFCKDHAPRIRLEATHEAGRWRFSVTDNGIGIAPEYREQLFVIFKRLHTRREYPGTGIGLAICKRIVERHGGEIGIEPAPDGGSVFWFTLPQEAGK